MRKKLLYAFWILFPLLIGGIVSMIISNSMDYQNLIQPPLAPPSILFPSAWTVLYLLMGFSYFLYRKNYQDYKTIFIYYLQLFFNALWSIIFFVWKLRLLSIIWIMILFILIIVTMYQFYQKNKLSAFLLVPYLIWVGFATYLNIGIYILN